MHKGDMMTIGEIFESIILFGLLGLLVILMMCM